MSRSFHSNIRKYIIEKNYKYSSDNIKEEKLNQIGEEISRKRITKNETILSRRVNGRNTENDRPFDPDSIEITVIHESKYVHFPAAKEDIVGVIRRMPYNVVSGIHSITLCLGKEYQEDKVECPGEEIRDPFTARICTDEDGPVYSPPTLGTYYTGTCKIFIYAYVYDRDELKLDAIEPYLRLQMLNTLVHEIAHHEDNILRTSRGRWLGFNDLKCEDYAESQQINWSKAAVIPYLRDTYPEEYNSLTNWIEKYGGVKLSLSSLAGESKGRKIGDLVKPVYSISSAVEDLFKNIIKGVNEHDAMLEFASDLHYGDHYEECLEVLNTILHNNPKDSEALGAKADTYIHQDEYVKAEETALECLSIDGANTDALRVLCEVMQYRKDWEKLKEISKLGIEAAEDEISYIRFFAEKHIIALLYLKEYEEAKKDINKLPNYGMQQQRELAFEALVKACSGDAVDALMIANRVLAEEKVVAQAKAILKAVSNYVIARQERNLQEYNISEYEQNYLLNTGIEGLLEL